MIQNWRHKGGGQFELIEDGIVPENFGCSDFTKDNYHLIDFYKIGGMDYLRVYQRSFNGSKSLPIYVIDLNYGEGDFLCFDSAWETFDYLIRILPMIEYKKKQEEKEEE